MNKIIKKNKAMLIFGVTMECEDVYEAGIHGEKPKRKKEVKKNKKQGKGLSIARR